MNCPPINHSKSLLIGSGLAIQLIAGTLTLLVGAYLTSGLYFPFPEIGMFLGPPVLLFGAILDTVGLALLFLRLKPKKKPKPLIFNCSLTNRTFHTAFPLSGFLQKNEFGIIEVQNGKDKHYRIFYRPNGEVIRFSSSNKLHPPRLVIEPFSTLEEANQHGLALGCTRNTKHWEF